MEVKQTFLIPTGPNDGKHLHAVVAVEQAGPNILLLSITSQKEGIYYDPSCEIKEGDHPFIKHDSYVLYGRARTIGKKRLSEYIESGYYVQHDDLDEELFSKICDGIELSEHSSPWLISSFNDYK